MVQISGHINTSKHNPSHLAEGPVDGVYVNQEGTIAELRSDGRYISVSVKTSVGNAIGVYQGVGVVGMSSIPGARAIAFSVVWENEYTHSHSATSWCGVLRGDEIHATWVLTIEMPTSEAWRSRLIGFDRFVRCRPEADNNGHRSRTNGV